ncbi:protein Jumonji isoform X8 [Leptidea sinapis]|uniref:protein Jumonji isoform X8 n=1 Tax=Leptidea sinapis TaxID=189913 RepID=UPI0021C38176|nr:protein Jumonji isoform X8 [Leptidea sinapis]
MRRRPQAQRKYAQGVVIPRKPRRHVTRTSELPISSEDKEKLIKVRATVHAMLDVISFEGIHPLHLEPVVILNRIDGAVPVTQNSDGENSDDEEVNNQIQNIAMCSQIIDRNIKRSNTSVDSDSDNEPLVRRVRNMSGVVAVAGPSRTSNEQFYVASSGAPVAGPSRMSDQQFYVASSSGAPVAGPSRMSDQQFYVASSSGAPVAGPSRMSDQQFYVASSSGAPVAGPSRMSDQQFYVASSGVPVAGPSRMSDGQFYVASSGAAVAGPSRMTNDPIFLTSSGVAVAGPSRISHEQFYVASSGVPVAGPSRMSDGQFYVASSGAALAGPSREFNEPFYLTSSGAPVAGPSRNYNEQFYMESTGAAAASRKSNNQFFVELNRAEVANFMDTKGFDSESRNAYALLLGMSDARQANHLSGISMATNTSTDEVTDRSEEERYKVTSMENNASTLLLTDLRQAESYTLNAPNQWSAARVKTPSPVALTNPAVNQNIPGSLRSCIPVNNEMSSQTCASNSIKTMKQLLSEWDKIKHNICKSCPKCNMLLLLDEIIKQFNTKFGFDVPQFSTPTISDIIDLTLDDCDNGEDIINISGRYASYVREINDVLNKTLKQEQPDSLNIEDTENNGNLQYTENSSNDINIDAHDGSNKRFNNSVPITITNPLPPLGEKEQRANTIQEAPVWSPTAEEFKDPMKYIEHITKQCTQGMLKVVPPPQFKPPCQLGGPIHFTVVLHYISRMYKRWTPITKEITTMRAYLASQGVQIGRPPFIKGIQVDLPKLMNTIEKNGGFRNMQTKQQWDKVAQAMNYTSLRNPQKRLDQMYVRHILPYATLSSDERETWLDSVDKVWQKRYEALLFRSENPLRRGENILDGREMPPRDEYTDKEAKLLKHIAEIEECIVRDRIMNLNSFKRIAATANELFLGDANTPSAEDVEIVYWDIVTSGKEHVCVCGASVDTSDGGHGFPLKCKPYCDSAWNLKFFKNLPGNLLGVLGDVPGVTVTTLHLEMAFSTSCWHRDPHGLPWIEYLHTGADKIWYSLPEEENENFRRVVKKYCPHICQNKSVWLPSDMVMIPPEVLLQEGVKLTRTVQKPGEYVIVCPRAYTCSVATGFSVSESVYFALYSSVGIIVSSFGDAKESHEPTMFSFEQLLIAMTRSDNMTLEVLRVLLEALDTMIKEELEYRGQFRKLGLKGQIRERSKPPSGAWNTKELDECQVCSSTLYLSRVVGVKRMRDEAMCPKHALIILNKGTRSRQGDSTLDLKGVTLDIFYSSVEIEEILQSIVRRCEGV